MLIVQFIMFLLFTIVMPFMPLFIMELGITDISSVKIWAGIVGSINSLFAALSSPFWGKLSDRLGRKPMVVRSCLSITIFSFLTSFAGNIYHLLVLRVLLGFFSGFAATSIALVGGGTPRHELGYALGWLQTAQVLGALAGPLIGGLLADQIPYSFIFQITAVLGLFATLLVISLVQETPRSSPGTAAATSQPIINNELNLRVVLVMIGVLFSAQFANRCVEPIMTLYVQALNQSPAHLTTWTGLLFATTGLGQLLAVSFFTRRSIKWGYQRVLLLTLAGAGLFYLPQAFVHNTWQLLFLRLGLGIFMGGIIPMANALIGSLTPADSRGRVYGLTSTGIFLGSFVGVMGSGLISAFFSIPTVFLVVGILLLINLIGVYIVIQSSPQTQPSTKYKATFTSYKS
ncbi:MAG: MFS transporter [Firmicutes bacterium]|nr:MFS transporter [Bacillota bacterium]